MNLNQIKTGFSQNENKFHYRTVVILPAVSLPLTRAASKVPGEVPS
jgi:hypothetical protein